MLRDTYTFGHGEGVDDRETIPVTKTVPVHPVIPVLERMLEIFNDRSRWT